MNKRVVVTGLGPICSIGTGKEEYWASLISGKSGVGKITSFDVSEYSCQIASQIKNFDPRDYLDAKQSKRLDRYSQIAYGAAMIALEDSNFKITEKNENDVGVIIGSGIGGIGILEEQHVKLLEKGPSRISPFLVPMMISNMAAGQVSILTGAKGFNSNVATACATANQAIGDAFEVIRRGAAKVMIAGGTEASITPLPVAGFAAMKALSTRNDDPKKASRPFDKERDGFVMGEGAGVIILEELNYALNRGAHIYAEVAGFGNTGDSYHMTSPDPKCERTAQAMRIAIEQGGLKPEDIDYINAHGTSTPINDEYETTAIKKVFGDHAYKLAISSTKALTGHLLGAAGGIEIIATIIAMQKSICPPTYNYEFPDPKCDLNYVPNKPLEKEINAAISNSFGFGGHNAVVAVRKFIK